MDVSRTPARSSQRLLILSGWAALLGPLLVSLWGLGVGADWQDDEALLRGVALVPTGLSGITSTWLAQLFWMLPVGGGALRLAMVQAFGVGLIGLASFVLGVKLLTRHLGLQSLTPLLALCGSLLVTLGTQARLESTSAGGHALAAGLMLALWAATLREPQPATKERAGFALELNSSFALGALAGLTLLESPIGALTLLLGLAIAPAMRRQSPSRDDAVAFTLGLLTVVLVLTLGLVLAGHERLVGLADWLAPPWRGLAGLSLQPAALGAWFQELGPWALLLAAGGGVWAWMRPALRPWAVVTSTLLAVDLVFGPARSELGLGAAAPLRLAALASLTLLAMLAVQSLSLGVIRLRGPIAKLATVLPLLFLATLVLVNADDAGFAVERSERGAAERFTDEALAELAPNSVLLLSDARLTRRLWTARLLRGQRPDLLVVPMPWLERGGLTQRLLEGEPALVPMLREVLINGRPSEFSLSGLADQRPLAVEPESSWERRLLEHLTPYPFWSHFEAQTVGRSDRRRAALEQRTGLTRLRASLPASGAAGPPGATQVLLARRLAEQLRLLASLGDRETLPPLLAEFASLGVASDWGQSAERLATQKPKGALQLPTFPLDAVTY